MIAGIVGDMKFERAAWIDTNVKQAERHGASRAALVQSDLALRRPVDCGLALVIRDEAPNVLHDDDGRGHWRRFKITQFPPLTHICRDQRDTFQAVHFPNLSRRGVPILNKSRRIYAFGRRFEIRSASAELARECDATLTARINPRCCREPSGGSSRMA